MAKRSFDLCTASLCDHAIFDYGTFGFWGAYLGKEGLTIAADNISKYFVYKENIEVQNMKEAHMKDWMFINAYN